MSGHNKWSTIKHKKGKEDARRGKIFTKLARYIIVALMKNIYIFIASFSFVE